MSFLTNQLEKRIPNLAKNATQELLNRLDKKDSEMKNVKLVSFPTNIQNNAQSTYMVIYVLDNPNNAQTMPSNIFVPQVDTSTYTIKAVTYAKDFVKDNLKALEDRAKDKAKEWVVNPVEKWFKSELDNLSKGTDALKQVKADLDKSRSWVNEWLVPHKTPNGQSNAWKNYWDPLNSSSMKLVAALALQMPDSAIKYEYKPGWEAKPTADVQAIKELIGNLGSMFSRDPNKKSNWGGLGEKVTTKVGDMVTGGKFSADRRASTQTVENPVTVFNYSMPEPRTMQFSFSVSPRNKEELYNLYDIIQTIKWYSHPSIGKGNKGLFYNYPGRFVIKYYTGSKENLWLHRSSWLGLTSFTESLTGEGGDMAWFENHFDTGTGNPPRNIEFSMSFMELDILSRDAISSNY